mgnify:CR=1 FL=1
MYGLMYLNTYALDHVYFSETRSYIAVFAVAFLMALGLSWHSFEAVFTLRAFEWFISISMCFLAVQHLQDTE